MARLTVRYKPTGQLGTVDDTEFDPKIYEIADGAQEAKGVLGDQNTPPPPPPSEKKGIIENIGSGIINIGKGIAKPFIETGKNIGTAATLIPQMLISGSQSDAQKAAELASRDIAGTQTYANKFDTGQTGIDAVTSEKGLKAIEDQVRDSGEIASYAIPFGKARTGAKLLERVATKTVLPGATSGALQGLNQEDATPESVVGSAALGAGGATLLHGISKIPGVLRGGGEIAEKGGQKFRTFGGTKITQKPSVYGASNEAAIEETLSKRGVFGTTKQRYAKLEPAMNQIDSEIEAVFKANPKKIKTSEIVDSIYNKSADLLEAEGLTRTAIRKNLKSYLKVNKLPDQIDDTALFAVKKKFNSQYATVERKIKNSLPLTDKEKLLYAGRGGADDAITKVHPDVKSLTIEQSHLYDAAKSLGPGRKNPPVLRAFGTSIPKDVTEGVASTIGAGVEKVGTGVKNVGVGTQAVEQALGGGKGAFVGSRTPEIISGIDQAGSQTPDQNQGINPDGSQYDASGNLIDHTSTVSQPRKTVTGYTLEELGEAYSKALMADDTAAANKLSDMYTMESKYQASSGGKPRSVTAQNQANLATAGLKGLNDAQTMFEADPNIVLKGTATGGLASRKFEAAMNRAIEGILRARSGAAVPESEVQKYRLIYGPKLGDTKETALYKLNALRQDLQGIIDGSTNIVPDNTLLNDQQSAVQYATQ